MDFEDFVDAAKTESQAHLKRGCGVGALLSTLPETDAEQVTKALAMPELSASAIRTALVARLPLEVDVPSVYTLNRHRRNTCTCSGR
ncbi:hypothetical protein [Streptomyces sp. NPDC055085]